MPRPDAILAISAHWYGRGAAVTAMAGPTQYDAPAAALEGRAQNQKAHRSGPFGWKGA